MRLPHRSLLPVAAGFAAVALVIAGAAITSSTASSLTAKAAPINANTLNGYHARDLVNSSYKRSDVELDNFNRCDFVTKLTQSIKAPVRGYVLVTGGVGAARDTDFTDPAELAIRLVSGGKVISAERATLLTTDGSFDGNVSVEGARPVRPGKVTIKLQLSECGEGTTAAFVTDRTISTLFVPFGDVSVQRPPVGAVGNR